MIEESLITPTPMAPEGFVARPTIRSNLFTMIDADSVRLGQPRVKRDLAKRSVETGDR
jgi:hypothetical protein